MQSVDGAAAAAALIRLESNLELARDLVPVLAAAPYIRASCCFVNDQSVLLIADSAGRSLLIIRACGPALGA